jgi:hypothetical protein
MDQLSQEPLAMADQSKYQCISESLMARLTTTSFATHSNILCHTAAIEQDKIGWHLLLKAKFHDPGECFNYNIIKTNT